MIVDANILIYAVDTTAAHHRASREWLSAALNGNERVGLPWESLIAFLRIATHPRAMTDPLAPAEAWEYVNDWCDADVTWHPAATDRHAEVLGELVTTYGLGANLVPDAHLAAVAIEHGLVMVSADTDFARFAGRVRWFDPTA